MRPIDCYRRDNAGKKVEVVKVAVNTNRGRVWLSFKGKTIEKVYDMALEDWQSLADTVKRGEIR